MTAERRAQSVQDVPVSISVLTGDDIQEQGITDIYAVQAAAPSVTVQQNNRSHFINIRGIGLAQQAPVGVPGVAYYVDGQFIFHEFFVGDAFYDLEAIEIVRGPQGTLTGQNSTGGAVFLRTTQPSYDAVTGHAEMRFGDFSYFRTEAALNLPISDNAAIRFAGVLDERDGFSDCTGRCLENYGGQERSAVRFNLQWEPSDTVKLNLRGDYSENNRGGEELTNINDPIQGKFRTSIDGRTFIDTESWRVSGEAVIDVSDAVALRTIVSIADYELRDLSDNDKTSYELPATQGGNSSMTRNVTKYEDVLQAEVSLLSSGESALQWVVGAFYYEETGSLDFRTDASAREEFSSNPGSIPGIIFSEIPVESKSLFGQIDWRFSDAWELTFGARYSDDVQAVTRSENVFGQPDPTCPIPCSSSAPSEETTGRIGLKYFAGDETMYYGTFSRGYKFGGNNPFAFQDIFEPEVIDGVEFGVKTELMDNRLRLSASVWSNEYDGLQLLTRAQIPFAPPGITAPLIQNAASADARGAEIELLASLDRWAINFGLTYLDNELSEDAQLQNSRIGQLVTVPKGTPIPFSADLQAILGVSRDFDAGSWRITPRLQVSYIDEYLFRPFNEANSSIEKHALVDVRVAAVNGDNWRLEGFVTNLLDEDWLSVRNFGSNPATHSVQWAAPRQVGVGVRYDF